MALGLSCLLRDVGVVHLTTRLQKPSGATPLRVFPNASPDNAPLLPQHFLAIKNIWFRGYSPGKKMLGRF